MPLYQFHCPECGAAGERFCHVAADQGAATVVCLCGSSMGPVLSMGVGLTWFEEARPCRIEHMGHEPVWVRSHGEHRRLMRERGLEWATKWPTEKTGGWV